MSEPKKRKSPKRYRVVVPVAKHRSAGHPDQLRYFEVKRDGQTVRFPHDVVVQSSRTVTVGDLKRNPPLINSYLAKEYPQIFVEET